MKKWFLILLAAGFWGCRATAGVQAWRTRDAYRGAILLKAAVQSRLDETMPLQRVELQFEDSSGRKSLLDVTPGNLDRYEGVVLVSLLPGTYRIRPRVTVGSGATEFMRVLEPESMTDVGSVNAPSGQAEVLGTISITIRPPKMGDLSDSRFSVDRQADTKRAIIRQALQFEESFFSGWKDPLEALLKGGLN